MKPLLSACLLLALSGCGAAAENPHPYDLGLEAGQRYVKNPSVKLKREYWVIFTFNDRAYFMVPRPDGAEAIAKECQAGGPRAEEFKAAMLCEAASSEAAVKRVNALSQKEAFDVSSFLHASLRFTVASDGTSVAPPALLSDIVDVCKSYPDVRMGALRAVCDRELGFAESGDGRPDIGVSFHRRRRERARGSAQRPLRFP